MYLRIHIFRIFRFSFAIISSSGLVVVEEVRFQSFGIVWNCAKIRILFLCCGLICDFLVVFCQ